MEEEAEVQWQAATICPQVVFEAVELADLLKGLSLCIGTRQIIAIEHREIECVTLHPLEMMSIFENVGIEGERLVCKYHWRL